MVFVFEANFLAVAQRAIDILAETCQTVLFLDPILLSCAKKSGVEPPRRNCESCCTAVQLQQKGRGPFEILGVPDLQCRRNRIFSAYFVNALTLN